MSQIVIKGMEHIPDTLKKYRKIFLVHGKSFAHSCVKEAFEACDKVDFVDFSPNPLYEDVCKGVDVFKASGCEVIVAVGGGSAMDVAKCIKLFSVLDSTKNYLEQEKIESTIPLIAIPTTAGTGSESTKHAVIYYKGEKQSISHNCIVPDCAILIPETLEKLPVYQKKCAMLDALCQAIESWWSVNSTEESIAHSKKAIQMICDYWKPYICENTLDAREKILEAANEAGRAINITATTAAHAMSYKITSMYGLPHGHAVAMCMPEVWTAIQSHPENCIDKRGETHLQQAMKEIEGMITLEEFNRLISELEMNRPKSKNWKEDIQRLSGSVNPVRLKNNPVRLEQADLIRMYERIVEEDEG